jgi:hypothetical protein
MSHSIITARRAVELVIERKAKRTKQTLYDNNLKKYTFVGACVSMALGIGSGVIARVWQPPYIAFVPLGLVTLSAGLALIYQLAGAWSVFWEIKDAERTLGKQLADIFNDDMDLINELKDFEPHHLEYAKDCFSTLASQLRSRMSLLVGALNKVGIIPSIVAIYFSWMKAKKDGLVFDNIGWLAAAFGVLYLLAMRMESVAQWMDRSVLIYKQALANKDESRATGHASSGLS